MLKKLALSLLMLACLAGNAYADNAVIAAGAGYKKMVNALATAFEEQTGQSLDLVYGNMGRVTALAKQSGQVDICIGAEAFFKKMGMVFETTSVLGKGQLVLAFPKGSPFSAIADLDNPKAGRIALPDNTKAIYGKAARQFLTNTKRLPDIKPRLVEVATVPQVFSYLVANEVDMGFMNLTHALNVADKLGGYVIVEQSGYKPIRIVAGLMESGRSPEQAKAFLAFLTTPEARAIITANGL